MYEYKLMHAQITFVHFFLLYH